MSSGIAPVDHPPERIPSSTSLRVRDLGIDTYQAPIIYMRADCPVCRAEGFEAQSRILVATSGRSIEATLHVVHSDLLGHGEAGLSRVAMKRLGVAQGVRVEVRSAPRLESFAAVRGKLYGRPFGEGSLDAVVRDVAAGRYADIELAAFVAAAAGERMSEQETLALTRAMAEVGERLHWTASVVADKHCVGGLPGNRTTLIVVPILASQGVVIPKTSSRAITSPAGTADAMETLAPVDLDLAAMRRVVDQEGACVVWGGAVALSPADDVLIRVERPLELDSDAQLVASVLSKKVAAGSTHVLIDIPVGPTAKVRTAAAAAALRDRLVAIGHSLGLAVTVLQTDGSQPVGRGIGPALEARDVLAVLHRRPEAPRDLRDRALMIAGRLLEFTGRIEAGGGQGLAKAILDDGRALAKFRAICRAQGGEREPPVAAHQWVLDASIDGVVERFDNRRIARAAKLAGAPAAPAAGLELHVSVGTQVSRGAPLLTLHAVTPGELHYALDYLGANLDCIEVRPQ